MSTMAMRTLAIALTVASGAEAATRAVFGTDQGAAAQVRVADVATGGTALNFFPYGAAFTGGVRVAVADVTGDGVGDVITGAGASGNGHVKVFNGQTGAEIRSFFAFPGFGGEVFVAGSDVTGDGVVDIVVGAGAGLPGAPVKVFDGRSGAEVRSFLALDGASGGVRVAGGDVNGDGRGDIILLLPTLNSPAQMRIHDGRTGQLGSALTPFPSFNGGVYVAAGDLDGDGRAEIVTGVDAGTASHVKVFRGTDQSLLTEFFPYAASFTGGVRVAVGDVTGDGRADLVFGAGPGAALNAIIRPGPGLTSSTGVTPFAADYSGGSFVAATSESSVLLADGFE